MAFKGLQMCSPTMYPLSYYFLLYVGLKADYRSSTVFPRYPLESAVVFLNVNQSNYGKISVSACLLP